MSVATNWKIGLWNSGGRQDPLDAGSTVTDSAATSHQARTGSSLIYGPASIGLTCKFPCHAAACTPRARGSRKLLVRAGHSCGLVLTPIQCILVELSKHAC